MTAKQSIAGQSRISVARRRQLFVERYLINGNNATDAAKFAGYQNSHAAKTGYLLLKHPAVIALLGTRAEKIVHDARLTTEKWAKEMACIGHFDPGELYDADGNLIPIHKLPEHVRRAIGAVDRQTRREGKGEGAVTIITETVRPIDKNTALANIGKHLGVFNADNSQKAEGIKVLIQLVG